MKRKGIRERVIGEERVIKFNVLHTVCPEVVLCVRGGGDDGDAVLCVREGGDDGDVVLRVRRGGGDGELGSSGTYSGR